MAIERFVDCDNCYGNGCSYCNGTGRIETPEGREEREAWEDGAYDRWKDAHLEEKRQ
jgi:hypothetical protein